MLKLFTFFGCLFLSFCYASAHQWPHFERVPVGSAPIAIYKNGNVFCEGKDINSNGIFDEGDELPSWWQYDIAIPIAFTSSGYTNVRKIHDMEFGSIRRPFRPALDASGQIYIPMPGRVSAYDFYTGELKKDTVIAVNATALSTIGDLLFISVRESGEKNYVLAYNMRYNTVLDTIPAYTNVQQTIAAEDGRLFILCEGTKGNNDSKLISLVYNNPGYEIQNVHDLGDEAYHIELLGYTNHQIIAASLKKGNAIRMVYPQSPENDNTIFLPVNESGGATETHTFNQDELYTSSLSGYIYIFDASAGNIIDSIDAFGQAESFVVDYYSVSIATPYKVGSEMVPDTNVTVYFNYTDVHEDVENHTTIYPNPVIDGTILGIVIGDKWNGKAKVDFITPEGKLLYEFETEMNEGEARIEMSNNDMLTSGVYLVRIITGDKYYYQRLSVCR